MEEHSGRSFRSKEKHFSAKTTIFGEKRRKFEVLFLSLKVEAKLLNHFHGRQDTQHNDTEQNATQHNSALNDTQHNNTGNRLSAYWA